MASEEGRTTRAAHQSSAAPRDRFAIEAAARFEKQLALVVASEHIVGFGPSVVEEIREETRASYRRDRIRWDVVSTRAERALVVTAWVAGLAPLSAFAWWAEGPPAGSTAKEWILAAIAPVVGLFWLCLLVAPIGLLVPKFGVWTSVRQSDSAGDAPTPLNRLPSWARFALTAVLALGMLVLILWLGRFLLPHWPRGVQGLWAVLVGAVVFFMVVGIVGVGWEMVFGARAPSDFRDQVLLSLFDCVSVARFGIVVRDPQARSTATGNGDVEGVAPPSWRADPQKRLAFVARLNTAARYLEGDAVRLAPRSAPEVRADLRDYGRRVAAGFRKHAGAVALGGKRLDDQVVQDLIKEYVAASQGRWLELGTTDAPALTKRLAVQVAQRLAVVGVLVAAALVVTPLITEGPAQAQIRGILLGSAVLALIAPRDAVNDLRDQAYRAFSGRSR